MKRRALLKHLRRYGCELLREDKRIGLKEPMLGKN